MLLYSLDIGPVAVAVGVHKIYRDTRLSETSGTTDAVQVSFEIRIANSIHRKVIVCDEGYLKLAGGYERSPILNFESRDSRVFQRRRLKIQGHRFPIVFAVVLTCSMSIPRAQRFVVTITFSIPLRNLSIVVTRSSMSRSPVNIETFWPSS